MAMAFTFQVLDNSTRNYILAITGVETSTTVAATVDGTSNGIIAANGYAAVTSSLKIRRIIYNTSNCIVRLQWHATSNTELVAVSGYGTMDLWNTPSLINAKAAGATGDIDLTTTPINAVTAATGPTAAFTMVIEAIKGFK